MSTDLSNRLGGRRKHDKNRTTLLESERPFVAYDSDTFEPSKYDDDRPDEINIMSNESGERQIKLKSSKYSSSIMHGDADRKRMSNGTSTDLNAKRPRLHQKKLSDEYSHCLRSRSPSNERQSQRSSNSLTEPRGRSVHERKDGFKRNDSQRYEREPLDDALRRDRGYPDYMASHNSRSQKGSFNGSDKDNCVESQQYDRDSDYDRSPVYLEKRICQRPLPRDDFDRRTMETSRLTEHDFKDDWQYGNKVKNDRRGYQNHYDLLETGDIPERFSSPKHTGMGPQSNRNIYDRVEFSPWRLRQRHSDFDLQPYKHDVQPNIDLPPERSVGNGPPIPYQSYRTMTRSSPPRPLSQHSDDYFSQIKESSWQERHCYRRPQVNDERIQNRGDLHPKLANNEKFQTLDQGKEVAQRESRSSRDVQKRTRKPKQKSPLLMPITINKDTPLLNQLKDKELEQDVAAEIMCCLMKKTVSKHRDMTVQKLFEHTKNEIPFESAEQLKSFLKQSDRCFKLITTSRGDKVEAVTDIEICQQYVKKGGSKTPACDGACGSLHICKFYIFDTCLKPSCDKDHEMFSIHNEKVLRNHGLHRSSPDKIKFLISKPLNRNMTTLPVICRFYNVEGTCNKKEKCPHLHICKFFVSGTCKFNMHCKRDHWFYSSHNARVLQKFRISKDLDAIALCLLLKKSVQSKFKSTRYFLNKAASKALETMKEEKGHIERMKPKEQNEGENTLSDISDGSFNVTYSDIDNDAAIDEEEETENDEVRDCCNDTPENGPDDLTDTKSLHSEDESDSEQSEDGRYNNVDNNLTNNESSADVDGEAQSLPKVPLSTTELKEKQPNDFDDKNCRQKSVDRDEKITSVQEDPEGKVKIDDTLQFTSKGKTYSFVRFDDRWRTVSETNMEMDVDDINGATIQQAYDILQKVAERINSSNLEPETEV